MKIDCRVEWERGGAGFLDNRYSRAHRWSFDGGTVVRASSSPEIVPIPMSDETAVDPEEAFVAAISSCHLLWFLAIAAKRRFVIDSYQDSPVGTLSRNEAGKLVISEVVLRPTIIWGVGESPSPSMIDTMHHDAHEQCFIANSVVSKIRIESQ